MQRTYRTIRNIVGPLLLVEGIEGVKNEELVEVILPGGDLRKGKVIELEYDTALVQVFEGTAGVDVPDTKVSFRGRGVELDLAPELLGRIFNGLGKPIDEGPPVIPRLREDINGAPINPFARVKTVSFEG